MRLRGDYAAANARKPDCANSLYAGLARYRLRQPTEALLAFQAAAQFDPKLVAAHLELGSAYEERRNDGEAIAAYARVFALEAKNVTAL